MADEKQPEVNEAKDDEKLLEDLDVDESTDVRGGRRAGARLSPDR